MFEKYCKPHFISNLLTAGDCGSELQAHVMFLVKLTCNTELFSIRILLDLAV